MGTPVMRAHTEQHHTWPIRSRVSGRCWRRPLLDGTASEFARHRLSAFGCFNGLSFVHWLCRDDRGSTEAVEIGG
jgi:hypothetical protein